MFSQISGHSVTQQVDTQKLIIRLPLLTTGTEISPNIMPRMQDVRTFIFIEFMVQLQSFFFLMSSMKWSFVVFLSTWHFDQAIKIYTQTFTLLKNTLHSGYTFIIDRFLFCIALFFTVGYVWDLIGLNTPWKKMVTASHYSFFCF